MSNKRRPQSMNFASIAEINVPHGRRGKHNGVVSRILSDIEQLPPGRALKIPLRDLPDSKVNVRSALNRVTRERSLAISTSSDEEYLYIWKSAPTKRTAGGTAD